MSKKIYLTLPFHHWRKNFNKPSNYCETKNQKIKNTNSCLMKSNLIIQLICIIIFIFIQPLCLQPSRNKSFSYQLHLQLTQLPTEYKSTLPDFLLTFIDSIIRVDKSQILRNSFLHYTIDDLLRQPVQLPDSICTFVDPDGEDNIFQSEIDKKNQIFTSQSSLSFQKTNWDSISPEQLEGLKFSSTEYYGKVLKKQKIFKLSKTNLVSIDQVRTKCQANIYLNPESVIEDIKMILAWNQVFRAKSLSGLAYLSRLFTNILQIINKKNFHSKFLNHKKNDFEKLISYESLFKIQTSNWPLIPQNFRDYEEIDHYVPAVPERGDIVKDKLITSKAPVQCSQNCACLGNQQNFCKYSLKDIWITQCPNRMRRVECDHQNPQQKKQCLNSQIKKGQKKKCKKDEMSEGENEIEECIIWGIDLFTRNILYHCLPECDINYVEVVNNRDYKNYFLQKTFLKAVNFNGNEGYDIKKACEFIIKNKKKEIKSEMINEDEESKEQKPEYIWQSGCLKEQKVYGQGLFTQKQVSYAASLLKNYEFNEEEKNKLFRIHTKGKGARCISKDGIKEGRFIVQYYGELYEPWKWYEREDFIKETLRAKAKDIIPEFYNIYLETHKDDPQGYDLMVVDPIRKGNFSSRFSHSCNPNCGTVATISDGKYYIGMYSFRDIQYGEQLTFDYCSMTQSNYEHTHSICLCGMERCRGFYLSLANNRKYSQNLDKCTCFLSRNSLILQALQDVNQQDIERCNQYNIKQRILSNSPQWITKWTSKLLNFMEEEAQMYKKQLYETWNKDYPWEDAGQNKQQRIELYSETYKQQLLSLRFQNLFTTIDKLKYFLNSIQDQNPPLFYLPSGTIVNNMITHKQSILQQIQDIFIKYEMKKQIAMVQKFFEVIKNTEADQDKLFYFRLCCLCASHKFLFRKPTSKFNTTLLSDIVYFYAFTHTYFSANQYKPHTSEQISVNIQEITGDPKHSNVVKKVNKKYSSQFVWGQLVSWFKQTIVSPQSSLSQDRRGTLSFPMIKSTLNSCYPHEKHCRSNFHKAIKQKPASCWPSAPNSGCYLSFRNPFKCYGTILFESVHNAEKLKEIGNLNLIQSCLEVINLPFKHKLDLFKKVELLLEGRKQDDKGYEILEFVEENVFKFDQELPEFILNQQIQQISKSKKKGSSARNKEEIQKPQTI